MSLTLLVTNQSYKILIIFLLSWTANNNSTTHRTLMNANESWDRDSKNEIQPLGRFYSDRFILGDTVNFFEFWTVFSSLLLQILSHKLGIRPNLFHRYHDICI